MLCLEQSALRHLAIMVLARCKHCLFLAWIPAGWQSVCAAMYLCNLSPHLILPGQPGLALARLRRAGLFVFIPENLNSQGGICALPFSGGHLVG